MDVITSIGLAAADDPYLKDCSLVIDAMATKKEKVWDSHNHEFVGYLNYGSAHPIDDESEKMAKEALVFLLVGCKKPWKYPVAYFFVDHPTADMQAKLIKECISLVSSHGMDVYSIVFDGCYANQMLGY